MHGWFSGKDIDIVLAIRYYNSNPRDSIFSVCFNWSSPLWLGMPYRINPGFDFAISKTNKNQYV